MDVNITLHHWDKHVRLESKILSAQLTDTWMRYRRGRGCSGLSRGWAPWMSIFRSSPKGDTWKNQLGYIYTGCPKKFNNWMLLDPRWLGAITSSWHSLCLEIVFWWFLTKTKAGGPIIKIEIEKALNFGKKLFLFFCFWDTLYINHIWCDDIFYWALGNCVRRFLGRHVMVVQEIRPISMQTLISTLNYYHSHNRGLMLCLIWQGKLSSKKIKQTISSLSFSYAQS